MTTVKPLFILTILFFLGTNLTAQETEESKTPETVLIRLFEIAYEGASAKAEPKILIVKPNGEVETKLLERSSMLKDADGFLNYNQVQVRAELQLWQSRGFHVVAMSTASPMTYLLVTTLVLTKN